MISQLSALKCIKRLFIFCFFSTCLFLFFYNPLHAMEKNPFNSLIPPFSASHTDSSFAPFINPVFSDISPNPSVSYMMQNFKDKENNNHYFLADFAGFIFSYSWIDNLYNFNDSAIESADTKLFTVGKGFFFADVFGFGVNYSFSKSKDNNFDEYRSLSPGLLFRPANFLSLGFVARDINNPKVFGEKTARSDVYSLSIRPLDFITISLDAVKYEGRKYNKSDVFLSTSLRFKYDISAFAGITKDRDLTFGLCIPLCVNTSHSAGFILDGYTSGSYGFRSSGFGITIAGERPGTSLLESKRFLKIIIKEGISEIETEKLFSGKELIFYDILNALNTAGEDRSIKGIIMEIDSTDLGFAQIQELRDQVKIFRSRNKNIYAVLNALGNKEYYLASACDKIYYNPANLFSITGLMAEVYFYKKGLDKIGIKFESVKKGTYKSFPEPFTREHMSQEFRENITALLSDLNDQFVNDIVKDRPVSREEIDGLFGKGLLTPDQALKAGFIDETAYPVDAEREITGNNKLFGSTVSVNDYIKENIRNSTWGPKPEIAVIYVSGSIIRGESQGYGISSDIIGDETYKKALEDAFTDSRVRALVIRVDSGGGSSLASELMWHYLSRLKLEYKKPVIFSFGNTAASGGYYIACTGDRIFGDRASITGSIGVIAGKLSLKELYGKLGINKDIIKMSEFADIFSEERDLSPEERRIIEQGVDYVYNRFTQKVADSRGIAKEDVDNLAEGRVFTGNQAKNNGLIDSLGGLIAAIELAKESAGIKDEYYIRHLPKVSAPIVELLGLKGYNGLLSQRFKTILNAFEIIEFKDEDALYYFPYRIVIK